jgi:hypothetical protein
VNGVACGAPLNRSFASAAIMSGDSAPPVGSLVLMVVAQLDAFEHTERVRH